MEDYILYDFICIKCSEKCQNAETEQIKYLCEWGLTNRHEVVDIVD